jgi:hypothetical protein
MFRLLKRRLRERLPSRHPVRIYLKPPPERFGDAKTVQYTWTEPKTGRMIRRSYVILLHPRQREGLICECLVHEWAHVLAGLKQDDEHTPEWGMRYGECWNLWLQVLDEVERRRERRRSRL